MNARFMERIMPKSRLVAVGSLALLVGLATIASSLVARPYSVVADILVILFFLMAAWYFGVVGAIAAWGVAVVVTYVDKAFVGRPVDLASDFRGFLVALTFGTLFQMRRSLKEKQAALEQSEDRFRRLAQASFEGLVITHEGTILDCNDTFARMMGLKREELLGRRGISFLAPADLPRAALYARAQDETSDPAPVEFTIHRSDGTTFEAELIGRSILHDEKHAHVLGVRDITDRKKTEEALRRNERLSALGTLVAGVAHEINNPLTYIQGNIELIQLDIEEMTTAQPASKKAAEDMLTRTHAALEGLQRIGNITKSLKQVARAPNRVRSPEDIGRLATNVVQIAGARMPPSVRVEVDTRSKRLVDANGSELAQVLLNLLFNATDALSERGGTIRLRTRDQDDTVIVEVHDDGPGIPLDTQAKLFTPFFTTKPQGTGLGLSVSRGIAKDHGGDLTFTSTPGEGTTFTLTLPALVAPRAS